MPKTPFVKSDPYVAMREGVHQILPCLDYALFGGHFWPKTFLGNFMRRAVSNDHFFRNLRDQELNNEILWAVAGFLFPDLAL